MTTFPLPDDSDDDEYLRYMPCGPPRSLNLRRKTAVITCADFGIGRSLAFVFSDAGYNIACVSLSYPLGAAVSSSSSSPGPNLDSSSSSRLFNHSTAALINYPNPDANHARDFVCDVTSPLSFAQLEKDIRKWIDQPITVLVNSTAVARVEGIEFQTCPEEGKNSWNEAIAVNLTGPVALTYQFLPGMLAAGEGCIMSVGSRNAVMSPPVPFMAAHNVSEAGLLKFHETLENEVGGRGVTNLFVVPGDIDPDVLKREVSVDEKSYRESEAVRNMVDRIKKAKRRAEDGPMGTQQFADVCVKLATMGRDAEILSGQCVDAERDLESLLEEARRGRESDILIEKMCELKIDGL